METHSTLNPALYLIPSGLSDADPAAVMPALNFKVTEGIRHFVVENVRSARRWIRRCLPEFSFEDVSFTELDTHTSPFEISAMLQPLRDGHPVGVISEAGCPAVADPGADIVALAQAEGFEVKPLVGPSSILLGLMGSGFNGQSFCFHGYLPIQEGPRRQTLRRLETESERENRTQIFIETPYRNNKTLAFLAETLQPDTPICVAADITAPGRESIVTKKASEWRGATYDYGKRPAIFLFYRGGKSADRLIYSTKGKRKR